MSELIVRVCRIDEIQPHPDATIERLEMARVAGWWSMVRKGAYVPGSVCLYVPVDAVLPKALEDRIFEGAKIRPEKGRIRTVKFRGAVSQGLIVSLDDVCSYLESLGDTALQAFKLGDDLAVRLGITKYEPPEYSVPAQMKGKAAPIKNPHFKEYTDIKHLKWNPDEFKHGEPVYVTEKLHGSSFRSGLVPVNVGPVMVKGRPSFKNIWKNIQKWLGVLPPYEFVYGSRRVQLDTRLVYDGFYADDRWAKLKRAYNIVKHDVLGPRTGFDLLWGFDWKVTADKLKELYTPKQTKPVGNLYARVVKSLDIRSKLQPGEQLFGEIVGPGVQANYHYGVPEGQLAFYAYDVMVGDKFLDASEFVEWCTLRGVPRVPVLHFGPYDSELMDKIRAGDSTIGGQKVREGVVIKPVKERNSPTMGRVVVKLINDDYYLAKGNTDHH